jgi:hypothetical protein
MPQCLPLLLLLALPPVDAPLDTTNPVVCTHIRAFRDYDERDPVELTADEKLVVYFEPLNYTIARDKTGELFRAHLVIDALLRRKGQKKKLWSEEKMINYLPEAADPPSALYLSSSVGLKNLSPGEYEVDLTLKDGLAPDRKPITRTISFRVVPGPG